MSNAKNYIYLVAVFLISIFLVRINDSSSFMMVYAGPRYDANVFVIIVNFLLFAIIVFHFHEFFEEYIKEQGVFKMTRFSFRSKVHKYIIKKIIKAVFLYWLSYVFIYYLCVIIKFNEISDINLALWLQMSVLYLLGLFFFLIVQFTLELYTTSSHSLLITFVLYFLMLSIGNYINTIEKSQWINAFIPVNLLSYNRVEEQIGDMYIYMLVFVLVIILLLFGLSKIKIKKIDI